MSINGIDKNRSDSEVNGVLDCSTEEQKCRLDWIIKNDISAVVNDILTFHEAIGNRGVRLRERWERNLQLERHCSGCCSLKDEGSVAISSESLELAKYHALWNNAAHRDADSSLEENFHIDVGKAIDLTRIIQGSNNMQNGAPGSQSNGSTSSAPSTQPLCSGAIKGQSGSDSDVYSGIPLLESISGKSNSMDALFEHADTNLLLDFDALKNGSKQPNEFTIPLDVQEVVDDIAGRATPPLSVDSLLVRELPEVDCYNGGKYDSFAPKKENIGLNSEQARNDGLTQGLTLLRTLSEEDWTAFDHPVDYEWQAAEGRAAASDDHVLTDVEITRSNAEHIKVTSDNADSFKSDEKGYEGTIGMLLDLCEAAKLEGEHLTTADYNFILVRMALATELVPDEILALMMQTYRQMADLARAGFRECRPNERSNEILLLALSRRLAAFQTAIDVMISLTNSDCFVWTPRTLEVTMQLCERKSYHGLARKLLNDLQSDTASEIDIPWGVYHSLINVLKIDDARRSVIEVLQLALKVRFQKRRRLMLPSVLTDIFHFGDTYVKER